MVPPLAPQLALVASSLRNMDEKIIAETGRRLASAAPNSRVILFGSHARGDAGARSGVEFLVIEPEVEDEAGESVRLMRDLRIPVEVLVVGRRYAEEWAGVRGSVVHAAICHGRVLVDTCLAD